jgi:hypothetical protein
MLGLMYLGAAGLYVALMVGVVVWAWRAGRANGGSVGKGLGFATMGFMVVFLPVFWNWLPVAIEHRRQCAVDAGFKAFVDPLDWVQQNRPEIEKLRGTDPNVRSDSVLTAEGRYRSTFMGGLLANEEWDRQWDRWGIQFRRQETRVVDGTSNRLLALTVNYGVGSPEDVRLWLVRRSCFDDEHDPITQLAAYKVVLKGALR